MVMDMSNYYLLCQTIFLQSKASDNNAVMALNSVDKPKHKRRPKVSFSLGSCKSLKCSKVHEVHMLNLSSRMMAGAVMTNQTPAVLRTKARRTRTRHNPQLTRKTTRPSGKDSRRS